jgi:hypothetical protein
MLRKIPKILVNTLSLNQVGTSETFLAALRSEGPSYVGADGVAPGRLATPFGVSRLLKNSLALGNEA